MEPTPAIPPFVFVDDRKYVLAETEECPKPEIFEKLTLPPRNVSQWVQWRLLLRRETDLTGVALILGFNGGFVTLFAFGDPGFTRFACYMMIVMSPWWVHVFFAIKRIYRVGRNHGNIIWLLQSGTVGKGHFFGMNSTGRKICNAAEMRLKYQFTTQEGNTYNMCFCTEDIKKVIKLSDESLKLILYDSEEPDQNVLFDSLPKGIWFDDFNGMFRTHPLPFIEQGSWLCAALVGIPAVTVAVAMFLC